MNAYCDNRNSLSSSFAISANDSVCEMRKAVAMIRKTITDSPAELRQWLEQQFSAAPSKKKGDLARLWGKDGAAVSKVLSGARDMKPHEKKIAESFFDDDAPLPEIDDFVGNSINEVDAYGGMGPGGVPIEDYEPDGNGGHQSSEAVRAKWVIPPAYMRHELDATPAGAYIIKAVGDSMAPVISHGDRVLVDLNHKRPSPAGIYAVWDGDGVVIKRVEQVEHGDSSRVRLVSENSKHKTYEVTLEQARIIGRVICKISAM